MRRLVAIVAVASAYHVGVMNERLSPGDHGFSTAPGPDWVALAALAVCAAVVSWANRRTA